MNDSTNLELIQVDETDVGQRVDALIASHFPQISRAKIQRSIRKGHVWVDGVAAKPSLRVKLAQQVKFELPEPDNDTPQPEDIPLQILYEDDHIVAINKPPAMVVHPAKGHWSGTLTAALAFHFQKLSSVGGANRPGIVHRLDRDTSGVILVAKSDPAHQGLASQFEQRTVKKLYLAIASPDPDRDRDLIAKPIGVHPYQREKMAIRERHSTSREAETFFEVAERFRGFAVIHAKPKTGRTHQIRVHLAHWGCPVLADKLYSGRASVRRSHISQSKSDETVLLDRQALHALQISFMHPISDTPMSIEAPLPTDIKNTIATLREFRSS